MKHSDPRPAFAGPDAGPAAPFPLKLEGPVVKGFGRGSAEVRAVADIPFRAFPSFGHARVMGPVTVVVTQLACLVLLLFVLHWLFFTACLSAQPTPPHAAMPSCRLHRLANRPILRLPKALVGPGPCAQDSYLLSRITPESALDLTTSVSR